MSKYTHTHLDSLVSLPSEQVVGPSLAHTVGQQVINGARMSVRARAEVTALWTTAEDSQTHTQMDSPSTYVRTSAPP